MVISMDISGRNKRKLGTDGEDMAAEILSQNGYTILDRNFRFGRLGEIDIIAREKGYICFIEVKTRRSLNYGLPCEAVTARKQETIRRIAEIYLLRKRLKDEKLRFDIVEIVLQTDKKNHINILKNAF